MIALFTISDFSLYFWIKCTGVLTHTCINTHTIIIFWQTRICKETSRANVSHLDQENVYPAMMHQATRATETIARRIGQVADALKQSKKQWFSELQKVAWKVCFTSYDVTFDERGVLVFYEKPRNF